MQSYHLPLFSAACQQKDSVTTALLTQSEYKYSFFCWRQNQLSQFKAALSYIHIYIILFNFAPSKHTSTVDFASRNVYVATCSWCMVRVAVPAPTQVFAERCSCLCYASSHHSVYLNITPFYLLSRAYILQLSMHSFPNFRNTWLFNQSKARSLKMLILLETCFSFRIDAVKVKGVNKADY